MVRKLCETCQHSMHIGQLLMWCKNPQCPMFMAEKRIPLR